MSTLISYAQNFEDIMLWRALSHVDAGCYVDVGAQSPDVDSVSRLFYEHGWRGVHVEPTPRYAGELRERRPDEIVLQMAVGDGTGILRFFEIPGTGLSTGDAEIAAEHQSSGFEVSDLRVPLVTLDTVLEQVGDRPVHWLKIDVEGAEKQVVDGWLDTAVLPWVLVIESTRPMTTEQSHHDWEPAVLAKGYQFVYFDGLNRFYVSDQHPELVPAFARPPNVFDDFSLSSSSTLCAQVNLAYQELESRQQALDALHEEEKAELQRALESQREAEKADLQRALESHQAEKADLQSAADAAHAGMEAARAALAERDGVIEATAVRHAATIEGMRSAYSESLTAFKRLVSQEALALQGALAEQTAEAESGRQIAHKWWLAHERLLRQLNEIESSRSWQITRPLRAVRRRLPTAALVRAKRGVRPLAVRMVRAVLSSPTLKRVLKPLIARIPFLYERLHALAAHESLFDKPRMSRAALEGREHDRTTLHMDKRAREVFADLQRARKEGNAA